MNHLLCLLLSPQIKLAFIFMKVTIICIIFCKSSRNTFTKALHTYNIPKWTHLSHYLLLLPVLAALDRDYNTLRPILLRLASFFLITIILLFRSILECQKAHCKQGRFFSQTLAIFAGIDNLFRKRILRFWQKHLSETKYLNKNNIKSRIKLPFVWYCKSFNKRKVAN